MTAAATLSRAAMMSARPSVTARLLPAAPRGTSRWLRRWPARPSRESLRPQAVFPARHWRDNPSRAAPRHVGALEHAERRLRERLRRERHVILQLLLEKLREGIRRVDESELREVPGHEIDLAQAAAKCREPFRSEGARRGVLGFGRKSCREDDGASRVFRGDAFACTLTNRSALLLFAIALRSSIGTFRSSSRVRSTRTPMRPSTAAFRRRATVSAMSFSLAPPVPFTPSSSPPWPGSMTIVWTADAGCASAGGTSVGFAAGGGAGTAG